MALQFVLLRDFVEPHFTLVDDLFFRREILQSFGTFTNSQKKKKN